MDRWDLLLPIGFITTDRSLLSGGDLCFYAMIVVCNWVLECCVRYEIQRAATPPGVPCGPGSSSRKFEKSRQSDSCLCSNSDHTAVSVTVICS